MLAFLDKIPYGSPRLRRILFWFLTAFLTYVLIGFLVIPPVLKNIVLDQCRDALHRPASIERVTFNPLTLRLTAENIKVDKLKGDGQLLAVAKIDASPSLSSIWKLAPVISHLHLRNLMVDITFLGEGKYSISDLIGARRDEEPEQEKEEDATAVFPFALYGFEMTNATIVFDDKPHMKKHVISKLNLLVPFTSSFLDLRKEFTQPKFSAVINGDPVELTGRTLPFDSTLLTEFKLGAVDIDLHQYWTYLPIATPLSLKEGRFTSEISLFFERPDAERLNLFLGGGGTLTNLKLAAPKDGTVLSLKELNFEMEKYSLGDNHLTLKDVTLEAPYFKVIRRADNAINWAGYFPGAPAAPSTPNHEAKEKPRAALMFEVRKIELKSGRLDWRDKAVPGGFEYVFNHFNFKATELSTHGKDPSAFEGSMGNEGRVAVNGIVSLSPLSGNATISGTGIDLPRFKPYFKHTLPLELDSGTLKMSASIAFQQQADDMALDIHEGAVTLKNLALRKHKAEKPSLALAALEVSGTKLDLKGRDVTVGKVTITDPQVRLVREQSGQIDLVRLFAGEPEAAKGKTAAAPTVEPATADKWTAMVKAVRLTGGAISYKDQTLKHPANIHVNGLAAKLDNVTTRQGATIPYSVGARWGQKGLIEVKGQTVLSPLKTSGALTLRGMSLRPFDGHLGQHTELLFASGAITADLKYDFADGKEPKFTVTGNTALNNLQLKDNHGDGEFAGIDAFKLGGIRFSNQPYRLGIANIHLQGPRAVVDIDKKGHLNIRRAFRIPEPPPVKEDEKKDNPTPKDKSTKPAKIEVAEKQPDATKSFFEALDIGKVTMEGGKLRFRDATVSPAYHTEISDMKLGLIEIAMSQEARPKVDFSAKIGPTPISVTGVLNPVVTPLYSDLAISVNGMELVPLSPYTIKNLAYPIEKGRLYADVTFKTADWELDAKNKFFIEQLVLGPKDKRPDAPNVPVEFGLALLQDGKGDMELNLPIKGRLDDPDFRIGGIVFKAITSLLFKALASPFTLIGSIFEGGDSADMHFVLFEPGRHALDKAGVEKMEATVKALKQRERLKLEVDGVIDPVADKSGLVEVIFENKLKQQKYDSLSRKERTDTTMEAMIITPEEYEEFLFEAYKDEPDKEGVRPTTLFMVDRQPVEFMEKFIIDRIQVTDNDMAELAMRRANAVKDHIITKEPALTQRVFLIQRQKDRDGKVGVPKHRADLGIK